MTNLVVTERHLPLVQLAKLLPIQRGKRTLRKWIVDGVLVPGRNIRVHLEGIRIAGDFHSSIDAYYRFVAAQNE